MHKRIKLFIYLILGIDDWCPSCLRPVAAFANDDMCIDCWADEAEEYHQYRFEVMNEEFPPSFLDWKYEVEHCDDEYLYQQRPIQRIKRALHLSMKGGE